MHNNLILEGKNGGGKIKQVHEAELHPKPWMQFCFVYGDGYCVKMDSVVLLLKITSINGGEVKNSSFLFLLFLRNY